MAVLLFKAVIPGRPIVKKNTQRVVGFGRSKHAIYSPQFKLWERVAFDCCLKAGINLSTITAPIEAHYKFYLKNKQGEPDTSNLVEGISDVLQKTEIISDDKQIIKFTAEKIFGEEPRTEVWLFEMPKEGA